MRFPLLAVPALAALGGCQARVANTELGTASHTITIVAKDYSFDAPHEVPSGTVTIRLVNQGREIHHVQLMRLTEGKTATDLAESVKHPGPLPAWATSAGGPNAGVPGRAPTESTLTLDPGTYAIVCVIPGSDKIPHFAKGMIAPLTVTAGHSPAGPPPASDLTMSLTDYAFTPSIPITVGTHTIRFENHGSQDHTLRRSA